MIAKALYQCNRTCAMDVIVNHISDAPLVEWGNIQSVHKNWFSLFKQTLLVFNDYSPFVHNIIFSEFTWYSHRNCVAPLYQCAHTSHHPCDVCDAIQCVEISWQQQNKMLQASKQTPAQHTRASK